MRWLFSCSKDIEHSSPRAPDPESKKQSQPKAKNRADGGTSTDLVGGLFQSVSVDLREVMVDVILGKLRDVFTCIFAQNGQGVGRHRKGSVLKQHRTEEVHVFVGVRLHPSLKHGL